MLIDNSKNNIFVSKENWRYHYDRHADLAGKTSLKVLGQFLLSTEFTCDCASESGLTEEARLVKLRDDLEIALRYEDEALRREVRVVVEEAWERGEMAGFLSGMRAGARVILSLTGEGEILI